MKLSEIKPTEALKQLLEYSGVADTIYTDDRPTSKLPDSFFEIKMNGGLKSDASRLSILNSVVLVSVNVKLLPNGATNTKKQDIVFDKISSLFDGNKPQTIENYHFTMDNENMVYSGKRITEGYSTKIINIKVSIY